MLPIAFEPPSDNVRLFVISSVLGFIAVLLAILVTIALSDAAMRHWVRECRDMGGQVDVVERALVCVGGKT